MPNSESESEECSYEEDLQDRIGILEDRISTLENKVYKIENEFKKNTIISLPIIILGCLFFKYYIDLYSMFE